MSLAGVGSVLSGIGSLAGAFGAFEQSKAMEEAAKMQSEQAAAANALARDQFNFSKDQVAYDQNRDAEAQRAMEEGWLASSANKNNPNAPQVAGSNIMGLAQSYGENVLNKRNQQFSPLIPNEQQA